MSWVRRLPRLHALLLVAFAASLASCKRYWVCAEPDLSLTSQLPQRLSETGLYADLRSGRLADGVAAYRPRFELWSDGAVKRRWISLPPGQRIDTSDMNDWSFPTGTKVWKEFSVQAARIETRLLVKNGPSDEDWIGLSYVWNEDQSEAVAAPSGAVDVRFGHDVPAAGECFACHAGRRGRILGFSAIQLAAAPAPGEIGLDDLVSQGRLSRPPPSVPKIPGNDVERSALGYLHANCSHCHNRARPPHDGPRCYDPRSSLDFTLDMSALDSVAGTPTYVTAIGGVVQRGDPDGSKLVSMVSRRGFARQMPPLATERVDDAAVAQLRAWVKGL